jgi:putative glutathione S-transferase
MAQLYDGIWSDTPPAAEEIGADGSFRRIDSTIRDRIEPDPHARFPAEAGRYHLFVAWGCPWASRTTAYRVLKGLTDVISLSASAAVIGREGWMFDTDTIAPFQTPHPLYRIYQEHDARYTGKATVPVLWDKQQRRIVNNESSEIIRILNTAFDHLTGNRLDLYPEPLRPEIDRWNALIYPGLNNGVYGAGFARSQDAYEKAAREVFATLDAMEAHLGQHRYLAGEHCTEADWRAFTTLVRFDTGYHYAFKCNLRRLTDYPALSGYLRELYQWPGIDRTVKLDQIKENYWQLIDPGRPIPIGPELDLGAPHGREHLPGKGIFERPE